MHVPKALLMVFWLLMASTICTAEDESATKQEESPKLDGQGSEKSAGEEQQFSANLTSSSNKTAEEDIDSDLHICYICKCSSHKLENPFTIDCRALYLDFIPPWDQSLSDADNIHLDLSFNNFNIVPPFEYNSYIDALFFNFNNVDSVTANAFSELPYLKTLRLYNNKIKEIHKSAFCGKNDGDSNLEILDLSKNVLSSLDADLFLCTPDLRQLILAGNQLMSLDTATRTALSELKYLELLDLSGNQITQLSTDLQNPFCYLTTLNLATNYLHEVPQVLQYAKNLNYLTLDKNPIVYFDGLSFEGLDQLKNLSISGMMSLTSIKTGSFQSLHNLKSINCNENPKLTTIEPYVFGGPVGHGSKYLESVEFRNNSLTHIDEAVFNGTHVHSMDIRGNPLNCSCRIFWITTKSTYYGTGKYLHETKCINPSKFSGVTVNKVNFQGEELFCPDFIPEEKPPKMPPSYTFMLVLVIISTFLILFFICYLVVNKVRFNRYHTLHIPVNLNSQFKAEKFNDAFDICGEEMEVYSK